MMRTLTTRLLAVIVVAAATGCAAPRVQILHDPHATAVSRLVVEYHPATMVDPEITACIRSVDEREVEDCPREVRFESGAHELRVRFQPNSGGGLTGYAADQMIASGLEATLAATFEADKGYSLCMAIPGRNGALAALDVVIYHIEPHIHRASGSCPVSPTPEAIAVVRKERPKSEAKPRKPHFR